MSTLEIQLTQPKVVVFDLGKVLVDFDFTKAARSLASESNYSVEQMTDLINQSPLLHRYETGLISTQEFFETIRRVSGYRASFLEFSQRFGDIFSEVRAMTDLNRYFRKQGLSTFVFSNTSPLAADYIRANFPFFDEFSDYILSYEHFSMKPDQRLYEVVEAKTKVDRNGILYFDDRYENIETARNRGWQAVWHQHPEKTLADLRLSGLII